MGASLPSAFFSSFSFLYFSLLYFSFLYFPLLYSPLLYYRGYRGTVANIRGLFFLVYVYIFLFNA